MNTSSLKRKHEIKLYFIAALLTLLVSLFFRTYPLHEQYWLNPTTETISAENFIRLQMKNQIKAGLVQEYRGLDEALIERLSALRLEEVVNREQEQFNAAVAEAKVRIQAGREKHSQLYLLGADPYYYLYLTKNIFKLGGISRQFKGGKFYNPLRLFPKGVWSFISFHPYLGYGFYQSLKFFIPELDLMPVLSFFPLLIVMLTVPIFFLFCFSLNIEARFAFIGSLVLFLAPIYLQRSFLGWYDTDPYNVLFPLLVLGCFFGSIENQKRAIVFATAAGLLTGIYSGFWIGWSWIFFVILFLSTLAVGIPFLLKPLKGKWFALHFLGPYLAASLLCLLLVMTPSGFTRSVQDAFTFLPQFASLNKNIWPSAFIAVGETRSASLIKFIFLTSNYWTFTIAAGGLVMSGLIFWLRREWAKIGFWLLWVLLAGPLVFLSLKSERFTLLSLIPFTWFVMRGCQWMMEGLEHMLQRSKRIQPMKSLLIRIAYIAIVLSVLAPQAIIAHAVAMNWKPIMNDAWYETLNWVKQKTPENSVIYSWWPPGHFITSIAERAVITDGASQHLPECYWMSRFFLAEEEQEGAGILRMLYAGGNQAIDFLLAQGIDLPEAVKLIEELVVKDMVEARHYLKEAQFDDKASSELLKLTHGGASGPAYVMLYNDMIDKTVAMSFMSGWNFERARRVLRSKNAVRTKRNYVQQMAELTDGILKYTAASPLVKKVGDQLFFQNGLIVNMTTKESLVAMPEKKINGQPLSLFYVENNQLLEMTNDGPRVDVSAVFFQHQGTWYSVLADRKLIRSMMFRLYYLRGASLNKFNLKHENGALRTPMYLQVFAADW